MFDKLHCRVISYGTTKNINNKPVDMEKKILEKKSVFVLMPDNQFKRFWNIIVMTLLLYVATYVPYSTCFNQKQGDFTTPIEIFDLLVDLIFGLDMFVNFISAYEDPTSGLPVVDLGLIARNYISGWFFLDLMACMPVQLIESSFDTESGKGVKLARLARLPRLYRLIRILRMVKMLRVFKKQGELQEWISSLNISTGMIRTIKTIVI